MPPAPPLTAKQRNKPLLPPAISRCCGIFFTAIAILFGAIFIILLGLMIAPLPNDDKGNKVINDEDKLPEHLRKWKNSGKMMKVNGFEMFVKKVECRDEKKDTRAPVVLFHGFPSSSFEFHRVVQPLCEEVGPVLLFDHVGFGFSEKPRNERAYYSKKSSVNAFFSFSVIDHAEQAIALLGPRHLNISEAHFVSHDMGSTILPEILGRIHRGSLPAPAVFPAVRSLTVTNGGMIYKLSQPRVMQVVLSTPWLGNAVQRVINRLDPYGFILARQLRTVWPPLAGEDAAILERIAQRDGDIQDIFTLLRWQGGNLLLADLIRYINDRKLMEWRWHAAYENFPELSSGRCAVVWGDTDAVAPQSIADTVHRMGRERCQLHKINGAGHFVQLETPSEWVRAVKANALREV